MLRDIVRGKDKQVAAVVEVITTAEPDVLVLWGIDWDAEHRGLKALVNELEDANSPLTHFFTAQPNRGQPTGFDINGNGHKHDPEDAQSFGEFTGQNGMAILSRWPIQDSEVMDFSAVLWRDLPNALLPWPGQPEHLEDVYRLASTSHWLVPIDTSDHGRVWLGSFAASTPVFDGPEDRNGRRNHDELIFWRHLLDGTLHTPAPDRLILAGHANLDPQRGDGRREAIRALLAHSALQDAKPTGASQHLTVDWKRYDLENMRLSYVLPTKGWQIIDAGVHWPAPDSTEIAVVETASRHRLVWVDVQRSD